MYDETVAILNDMQFPHQDDDAVDVALQITADAMPDRVVLAGDVIDGYVFSEYLKSPRMKASFQEEIDEVRGFFKDLRGAVGDECEITWIEGNHEFRSRKYAYKNAAELEAAGMVVSMEERIGIDDFGVHYVKLPPEAAKWDSEWIDIGDASIGHFNRVRADGGAARSLVTKRHRTAVQGHTHRMHWYMTRTMDGKVMHGIENGCLCRTDPHYTSDPDWVHGMTIMRHNTKTGEVYFQVIPIINGVAWFGNKEYTPHE